MCHSSCPSPVFGTWGGLDTQVPGEGRRKLVWDPAGTLAGCRSQRLAFRPGSLSGRSIPTSCGPRRVPGGSKEGPENPGGVHSRPHGGWSQDLGIQEQRFPVPLPPGLRGSPAHLCRPSWCACLSVCVGPGCPSLRVLTPHFRRRRELLESELLPNSKEEDTISPSE